MSLPPLPPLFDGDIRTLYVAQHGTDEGWLGRDGSYFIAGVQAARTYAEQYGRLCAEAERAEILAELWELRGDGDRETLGLGRAEEAIRARSTR